MTNNNYLIATLLATFTVGLTTGCTATDSTSEVGPHVVLLESTKLQPYTSGPVFDGAARWQELGYSFDFSKGLEECVYGAVPTGDCLVMIKIGTGAQTQTTLGDRSIVIASTTPTEDLSQQVAHEVGHVLLNSLDNSTETGVMADPPTPDFTDADRAFVCAYGGLCE